MLQPQSRILISNDQGEKLVGTLHEAGSKRLVILCHGFRSSKVIENFQPIYLSIYYASMFKIFSGSFHNGCIQVFQSRINLLCLIAVMI